MKRLVNLVLSSMGLTAGAPPESLLSPSEFTSEFLDSLRKTAPHLEVTITEELRLSLKNPEGKEYTAFLDNAYSQYKSNPLSKRDVIKGYVQSNLAMQAIPDSVDRSQIVPVIKDKPWLDEMRRNLMNGGAKDVPEHVYDDFAPGLVVVYAEDLPTSLRYLNEEALEAANIHRDELRSLACDNLKRLLPQIEKHGDDGVYMLTAGGNYEASLLLLESIWSGNQFEVKGEIVVAIPTRDCLFVTGSEDAEGLERICEAAAKAYNEGTYYLSNALFVCRNGKFEPFAQAEPQ